MEKQTKFTVVRTVHGVAVLPANEVESVVIEASKTVIHMVHGILVLSIPKDTAVPISHFDNLYNDAVNVCAVLNGAVPKQIKRKKTFTLNKF